MSRVESRVMKTRRPHAIVKAGAAAFGPQQALPSVWCPTAQTVSKKRTWVITVPSEESVNSGHVKSLAVAGTRNHADALTKMTAASQLAELFGQLGSYGAQNDTVV